MLWSRACMQSVKQCTLVQKTIDGKNDNIIFPLLVNFLLLLSLSNNNSVTMPLLFCIIIMVTLMQ